ncbi:cytosolic endo-beta-N-acetylglucosaminidase 1-like protein [Cinnamomum micranthum f. kanehirae]|uniref:mannosyl-glycoprotein endo-beta-N-acetylglucosaminidase n=1 Tax=Cinnamomum micranthum f. kanehirae TaxID=337451 RepID=A0A3S3N5N4_9MAGN|nr:cytosolic endo-beta-N-acetylglucosaminidase 1-like protein [Cinnamomum micranthum f. kanehirae]
MSLRKTIFILIKAFLKPIQLLFSFLAMETNSSSQPSDSAAAAADPFDPTKPSIPIAYPIKKLEDLLSRSYFDSFHLPFNRSSVHLPPNSHSPSRPRILVCHDMAGGYIDDKWVQGGTNADAYAIWHWHLIDVFVYFSHDLVTIPPPCWTNTAHTHGVKVLGTFIVEWDAGTAIANILLSTKESARTYAERLTELAVTLGFDGWLINMEVELDSGKIPNLKEFVSHLTNTMHASVPESLVIWYDSVTKDGQLIYQNQLNEYNKPFFDICDGLFANYSWQEDYPKLSAAVAGERKFDVYMGIDVFGRNTYGGGQWTTNVALDVIKKNAVSAAIFAPGWVYETKQKPDFQTAQNRWWGLVEKSWGIQQHYPKVLPFYSNFDQGHGYHVFVGGLQVSADSWNNISSQSFQPVLDVANDSSQSTIKAFVNFKDASYSGGGNITLNGSIEENASFMARLFQAELPLERQPVHISYSVKSDGNSLLGLALGFAKENKRSSILLATGQALHQLTNKFDKIITPLQVTSSVAEVQQATGWIIQETSIQMHGYTLTDIHIVCYRKGKHDLQKPMLEHESVDQEGTLSAPKLLDFNASLGHISIRTSMHDMVYPPAADWVVKGQYISWASGSQGNKTVSLKIIWNLKHGFGDALLFSKYNIYVEKPAKQVVVDADDVSISAEYIGVARTQAFYVSSFTIPSNTSSLKFIIQVCGIDGSFQNLHESPSFLLDVVKS